MAILYDLRGNEYPGHLDAITGLVLTDARTISATLGAVNAETLMDVNGYNAAVYDVRTATANLTFVFEGTIDGSNYVTLPAQELATELVTISNAVTAAFAKQYYVNCTGFRRVRCRISVYTSANIVVSSRATQAQWAVRARPMPSNLFVTATAAVNVGATATLPAPATGMYHYITSIELVKLYSVVGVAAGAGVLVTSTNLYGAIWTTEQNASPAGATAKVIDRNFSGNPLKSAVAATATTIVAPAQLQTIWRWNVSYYVDF
jgi:hypothetical protein